VRNSIRRANAEQRSDARIPDRSVVTMKSNPALAALNRAVGTWTVTGSHPYLPARTLRGRVTFERIESGGFLRMNSKMADKEIPESIAIFGTDSDDHA
jgi:hypothetical protein